MANEIEVSKVAEPVRLMWFRFRQNNSGGYHIVNDTVAENLFVQAESAVEANERADEIVADYSEYCGCCGERWETYARDKDGTPEPMMGDEPLRGMVADFFDREARLHYFDGTVEVVVLPGAEKYGPRQVRIG